MPILDYSHRAPWTVEPGQSVREAARCLADNRVGCVVVVEDGKPVGVLTDRDISLEILGKQLDASSILVRDLVRRPVVTLPADASLPAAVQQMRNHRIRRLPLVDPDGRLVGLVALDDLLVLFVSELQSLSDAVQRQLPERRAAEGRA